MQALILTVLILMGRSICIWIRLTLSGPNEYAIAQVMAAQTSVALPAHREIHGRGVAMTSRTIIGQAEGILMERLGIDADQAFAYLRRVSQSQNRKLIMICSEIVKMRRLPQ
jgi:AmiR/NasT family two-component response regulator